MSNAGESSSDEDGAPSKHKRGYRQRIDCQDTRPSPNVQNVKHHPNYALMVNGYYKNANSFKSLAKAMDF